MTIINCSRDCIYQKDGKCNLEDITFSTVSGDEKCIYYASLSNSSKKNSTK